MSTRRHSPEEHRHPHRRENIKPHKSEIAYKMKARSDLKFEIKIYRIYRGGFFTDEVFTDRATCSIDGIFTIRGDSIVPKEQFVTCHEVDSEDKERCKRIRNFNFM
jgi:hypothetical protein